MSLPCRLQSVRKGLIQSLGLLSLTVPFAFLSAAPLPERAGALDIFNIFFLLHLPSPP